MTQSQISPLFSFQMNYSPVFQRPTYLVICLILKLVCIPYTHCITEILIANTIERCVLWYASQALLMPSSLQPHKVAVIISIPIL